VYCDTDDCSPFGIGGGECDVGDTDSCNYGTCVPDTQKYCNYDGTIPFRLVECEEHYDCPHIGGFASHVDLCMETTYLICFYSGTTCTFDNDCISYYPECTTLTEVLPGHCECDPLYYGDVCDELWECPLEDTDECPPIPETNCTTDCPWDSDLCPPFDSDLCPTCPDPPFDSDLCPNISEYNISDCELVLRSVLKSSDSTEDDDFSRSVSIDGNYAIVGANKNDDNGTSSGSAYIFIKDGYTWIEQAKLTASDAAANDFFGQSVSISGDYAIIGANNNDGSGSAYIFYRSGSSWSQQAKLVALDAAIDDDFGISVSIDGDYAIIGASGKGLSEGASYIFVRSGTSWSQQGKLEALDGASGDEFGFSVSIDGNYAIIGAIGDETFIGAAYIFYRVGTSWSQQAKIVASDGTYVDLFGHSVSISGDYSIIGARGNDDVGSDSGSAYIFYRTGTSWNQQAKIVASDAGSGDLFGYSVSISGDYAIVGAYKDDDDSGSSYIFVRSGTSWTEKTKLTALDPTSNDMFGVSVSISSDYAIVGAIGDNLNTGSIWIYSLCEQQCTLTPVDCDTDECPPIPELNCTADCPCDCPCDSDELCPICPFIPEVNCTCDGELVCKTLPGDKVTSSDGASLDRFGHNVHINGDYSIVGAYGDDSYSGSAYIFYKGEEEAKLIYADGSGDDRFGWSVSIFGNYAIVGAVGYNSSTGAAHIFYKSGESTWIHQAKLVASDGGIGERFGHSVSIYGEYAIVGSILDDTTGSAYIYFRVGSTWTEQAKLIAADVAIEDNFGISVSMFENYVIVGAYGDDDFGTFTGSAYIFVRSGVTWTEQIKLVALDAGEDNLFGYSVSIYGDYAIVGAIGHDGFSGAAYIFYKNGETTWIEQAKLTSLDINTGDYFGQSVSISGDYAIVGAYGDDDTGSSSGSAYLFARTDTTWIEQEKITASDGTSFDYFGGSVSIFGNNIIIGAYGNADYGFNSGSIYFYPLECNFLCYSIQELNCTADCPYECPPFDSDLCPPFDSDLCPPFDSDECPECPLIPELNCTADCPLVIEFECDIENEKKLKASDFDYNDHFGESVSIDGDYTIIGTYGDDDNGSSSGSAYIFYKGIEQVKLIASDADTNDQFGKSVSISGDYVIVSAFNNDDDGSNSGSAYIFYRVGSTWTEQAKLVASDPAAYDNFGNSVSIFGDYAIVGSKGDDDGGSSSGSAYIFYRTGSTWNEQAKLVASDPAAYDNFGTSVSIFGDYAIIGANGDDGYIGAAYIFYRTGSTWNEQAKLVASDPVSGDQVGYSVSISGNYAIVGAYGNDDGGSNAGAAYIFVRSGSSWSEQAKLVASDAAASDFFGWSVSIDGDSAFIGAYGNDDDGSNSGSAYIFVRNNSSWNEELKLTAFDGTGSSKFGFSVDVSGKQFIVGANADSEGETFSGSAYLYSINCGTGECTECIECPECPLIPELNCTADCPWDSDLCPTCPSIPEYNRSDCDIVLRSVLESSDAASGDRFGYSVSIDGDYAIVGASFDNSYEGSAYILIRSGVSWNEQAKLVALDVEADDRFGHSVSISGDYVIIGAKGDDDNGSSSGSAYIFVRSGSTWSEQAKLVASDADVEDYFGSSVSIDGDYAIVGAWNVNSYTGSAYIFYRTGSTWSEQAKLVALDAEAGDRFGYGVSISGDYAIIGAYGNDDNGSSSGSAYIFVRSGSTWSEQAKLISLDADAEDFFGSSVSIDGDYAIVGAWNINSYAGSAYIFYRTGSTWSEQAKLVALDAEAGDYFSYSVSISGDYVIIGAYGNDDGGILTGSAYIFVRSGSTWNEQAKLVALDAEEYSLFGTSVSIDGDYAIIGASGDNSNKGTVHIYSLCEQQCTIIPGDCDTDDCPECPECPEYPTPTCDPACINGICLGNLTTYSGGECACYDGWEGTTCQIPTCPSECDLTCSGNGECVKKDDSCTKECCCDENFEGANCDSCITGYEGVLCDEPICDPLCDIHGECVLPQICKCDNEYWGTLCDITFVKPYMCYGISAYNSTFVCSGHGSCLSDNDCICDDHYSGGECETKESCYGIDYDDNVNVCGGHGDCSGGVCTCDEHYYGSECESTTIFECFGISELNHSHVCSGHGDCKSGLCDCDDWYSGDECEIYDIPTCKGLDALHPFVCTGDCIANETCFCDHGFKLDENKDCLIMECNAIPWDDTEVCSNNGDCQVPDEICSCAGGWAGEDCEKPLCDEKTNDDPTVCSGKGICIAPNLCNCTDDNYYGANCDINMESPPFFCKGWDLDWYPFDDERACGPHGTCVRPHVCRCDCKWNGNICQFKRKGHKRICYCNWKYYHNLFGFWNVKKRKGKRRRRRIKWKRREEGENFCLDFDM